jgi:hypothetical protein
VKPSLTLPAIALALAAAGCGGGTVIDPEAAAEDIRAGFAARDVTVTAVDCPSDVGAEEGGTYECRVETSEGDFRVVYRQLDGDGKVSQPRLESISGGGRAP